MADTFASPVHIAHRALTAQEALSGIFGSISLAAWIFLLVPQLLENYRQQSAHGISLAFLLVWFLGDITNLAGAIWAQLVPTVIALAVYFCFADVVLIAQCLYYNFRNRKADTVADATAVASPDRPRGSTGAGSMGSEEEPLLSRQRSTSSTNADNMGLPGSRRRKSSAASGRRRTSSARRRSSGALARIMEEEHPSKTKAAVKNLISILLVCAAGTAGWAIAWKAGVWRPADLPGGKDAAGEGTPFGAEVLGYISAIAYLGARIPQIVKNWRDKSCDGLSLLFFMLSLLGNLTYGAGILFHSLEKEYIITNTPWLIGSLGTMVEDITIFIQFHVYGDKSLEESIVD